MSIHIVPETIHLQVADPVPRYPIKAGLYPGPFEVIPVFPIQPFTSRRKGKQPCVMLGDKSCQEKNV